MVSWLPLSNEGPVWDSYILLFSHSSEIKGYCLMKLSRKNASEFANIFEIRKPKLRKKNCLRIPKIWQIWSISLDNFIKHKPLISKRWCYREQKTSSSISIHIQLFFSYRLLIIAIIHLIITFMYLNSTSSFKKFSNIKKSV